MITKEGHRAGSGDIFGEKKKLPIEIISQRAVVH
jgi:hypothetical protein